MDLIGKRAVVAGGTGEVGEGIVRQLALAGASVIVPARSEAKLDVVRLRLGEERQRVHGIVGEFATLPDACEVRGRILEGGPVDVVVASLGGWWQGGTLPEVAMEDWDRVIENNLTTHFVVARTYIPLLHGREGSHYIQITGGACEMPIPNSSLISITAAGVRMLGRMLETELRASVIRISQVEIDSPVASRSRPDAQPSWVTADEVGEMVVRILTGAFADPPFPVHMKMVTRR